MAKTSNIAVAAKKFSEKWAGQGYEKGQSQSFWLELLQSVYGVQNPFSFVDFEGQIKNRNKTSFMDAYIPSTKVLIEQKSIEKDLDKPIPQSDGSMLTPYEQAKKYVVDMPLSKHPRWVVTCNFREFRIYDMENPQGEPEVVKLKDLEKEYYRLSFLVDDSSVHTKKEVEVSMAAGRIIGEIYDAFLKEYRNPEDPHTLRSLNILCVRLVFCLYAEDSGLFEGRSQFHDYLVQFKPGTGDMRRGLLELFDVLNTPVADRDPYMRDDLLAFPYVNGGLFAEKDIEVPRFNETIATLLLKHASDDFDWSEISPTIFGGVFESTLNPETRRKGGMHYTSIENIHKVIDPLFLDDLKAELDEIKVEPGEKKRINRARQFQDKIAGLKFLDPACGSGNFLTETFLSLRRLENEAIRIIYKGQMILGDLVNPIKVSIGQFYGIEINDFAVSVAMTALWIAEAQMLFETEKLMQISLDFLPLKSYTNIHEGNALRIDWNDVIPASELNYIMGNPPFIGNARLSDEQKIDRDKLFPSGGGDLDYVACWYKKAADYIMGQRIKCAFVSTNSICQGQQVYPLWKPLTESGVAIDFAYTTFRWDSEANEKAHVYCVIIGFSREPSQQKVLYSKNEKQIVAHINGYLIPGPDIFIDKRRQPLSDVPQVIKGFQPTDNGYLVLEDEDRDQLLQDSPEAEKWIRPFITAKEYIHGKSRWCLWLKDASPAEINRIPGIKSRVSACRLWRLSQTKTGDAYKLRDTPSLMRPSSKFTDGPFVVLPRHTGESRLYIPFGFANEGAIPGDSVSIVPAANLYHFGVLCSSTHMAWTKVVCGRLEMRFRYTSDIVYNNFPWPNPNQCRIAETAQGILNARSLYPDSSLADLYDPDLMPFELRKAHRANDAAVMEAYGFRKDMTEPEIVAELFKMYQKLTKE